MQKYVSVSNAFQSVVQQPSNWNCNAISEIFRQFDSGSCKIMPVSKWSNLKTKQKKRRKTKPEKKKKPEKCKSMFLYLMHFDQ